MHVQRSTSPSDEFMAPSSVSGSASVVPNSNDQYDPLNGDVFEASITEDYSTPRIHLEPSDVPRLRASQNTSGYREGIAVAKDSVAQDGFDEGYPLGATLGMRSGLLLGIVEGIAAALMNGNTSEGSNTGEEATRLEKLLAQARHDLGPQRIFSPDYWEVDGNWKYEVPVAEGHDVVFEDVAKHHPMIQKWEALSEAEEEKWGLTREVLRDRDAVDDSPVQKTAGKEERRKAESVDPLQW